MVLSDLTSVEGLHRHETNADAARPRAVHIKNFFRFREPQLATVRRFIGTSKVIDAMVI
jgi:hypothetical protein